MKCPACNKHELKESAWLPCEDEQHKDYNYYDCANCGPVQKDYVDAVQARVEALEAELAEVQCLWMKAERKLADTQVKREKDLAEARLDNGVILQMLTELKH